MSLGGGSKDKVADCDLNKFLKPASKHCKLCTPNEKLAKFECNENEICPRCGNEIKYSNFIANVS